MNMNIHQIDAPFVCRSRTFASLLWCWCCLYWTGAQEECNSYNNKKTILFMLNANVQCDMCYRVCELYAIDLKYIHLKYYGNLNKIDHNSWELTVMMMMVMIVRQRRSGWRMSWWRREGWLSLLRMMKTAAAQHVIGGDRCGTGLLEAKFRWMIAVDECRWSDQGVEEHLVVAIDDGGARNCVCRGVAWGRGCRIRMLQNVKRSGNWGWWWWNGGQLQIVEVGKESREKSGKITQELGNCFVLSVWKCWALALCSLVLETSISNEWFTMDFAKMIRPTRMLFLSLSSWERGICMCGLVCVVD